MVKQVLPLILLAALAGCAPKGDLPSVTLPSSYLLNPRTPEFHTLAPREYKVRMETSKGTLVIECKRKWAPLGNDRFYNLVRAGYYDGVIFNRVAAGKWAQFGINGAPAVSKAWRTQVIDDDPPADPKISNTKGTLSFAFAVPNGRTTQLFFNLQDNSATHDGEPFVPIGKVVEGDEVLDKLNSEYGENAGSGIRSGRQDPIFERGNAWLDSNFPRLDRIITARIIDQKP